MHRTVKYEIDENNEMYEYCKTVCTNFKKMYNVANFYIRNVMTGIKKSEKELTLNEKEILKIVSHYILLNNSSENKKNGKPKKQLDLPTSDKWFLGYQQLNAIFSLSDNIDYRNLQTHMAQKAIKKCVESWKSYFSSNKDYKINPNKYNGRCKLPKYIKTEMTTAQLSNQTFRVKTDENGRYVEFAKLKDNKKIKGKFYIGNYIDTDEFEMIEIKPYHSSFILLITYIDNSIAEEIEIDSSEETRVMGIDIGVKNFATITDNLGNKPIVIKGGFLKSRNQYFNKYKAIISSNLQKGLKPNEKHKVDKKLDVLSINRDRFFRDCFYKIAHRICRIAKERDVNQIVIGHSDFWKQEINIGTKNNQNFVTIPFSQFISTLTFVGLKYGIKVIENEESYTSKASFLDEDEIPTFQKDKDNSYIFSGKRIFRGLYKSKDGILINADVNASLNIIRKFFGNGVFTPSSKASCIGNIQIFNYYDFYPNKKHSFKNVA